MKDAFKIGNTAVGLVAGIGIGFIVGETSMNHRVLKMITFPIIFGFLGNLAEIKIQDKIKIAQLKEVENPNPTA